MQTLEKTRPTFKEPAKPTTEEIVSAYNSITANTGTYEISGDSFTVNVLLADAPLPFRIAAINPNP
jgi:hypothetical protein